MHDRNGSFLQVGDIIQLKAQIVETYACEDFCNVRVAIGFEKPHGADNVQSNVTINARQALLLKRAE